MAAKTAKDRRMPSGAPTLSTTETGSKAGSAIHQSKWIVASSEPMMKKARVISMRALPPPAVNSVPEAQPPPSCMPTPNMKAPTITPVPAEPAVFYRDWVVMTVLTVALFLMGYGFRGVGTGRINRIEGAILLSIYLGYTGYLVSTLVPGG